MRVPGVLTSSNGESQSMVTSPLFEVVVAVVVEVEVLVGGSPVAMDVIILKPGLTTEPSL